VQPHVSYPMQEPTQVGEARRHAQALAVELGLDEVAAGRLAIVVTELGNNLVRHARAGRLLLGIGSLPQRVSVEVFALDGGPGMQDLQQCLSDGYSSQGTPGTGLGAVRRQSDRFDVFSLPGTGTVMYASVGKSADRASAGGSNTRFEHGAVLTAAPGEQVSGDGWALQTDGARASLTVVDGLGHGPEAAAAAAQALDVFAHQAFGPPSVTLQRMHESMRGTRGAAAAVAVLDLTQRKLSWCGAGNIAGRIISGVGDRSLMSQHGTVGVQVRSLTDIDYPWPDHGVLVMHSDGLASRWPSNDVVALMRQHPALIAARLLRDHSRGRDDATAVVLREH
jgi:anti-sigma regulatory factor (Ser/Thr protein kinase)